MDGKPVQALPGAEGGRVADLQKRYTDLDTMEVPKLVLPPFPCGWYELTGQFGEVIKYQFRYIPRARRHAGRHGLFLKDPDAGMVLIGYVVEATLVRDEKAAVYIDKYLAFKDNLESPALKLVKRTCAVCGRALNDLALVHSADACTKKIGLPPNQDQVI